MNARVFLLLMVVIGYATMWSYDKQDHHAEKTVASAQRVSIERSHPTPESGSLYEEIRSSAIDCRWSDFDNLSLCDVTGFEADGGIDQLSRYSRRNATEEFDGYSEYQGCEFQGCDVFERSNIEAGEKGEHAILSFEAAPAVPEPVSYDLGHWTGPELSLEVEKQSQASVADRFMNRCSVANVVVAPAVETGIDQAKSQQANWFKNVSQTRVIKKSQQPVAQPHVQNQIPLPVDISTGHYRVVRSDGWIGKIFYQANEEAQENDDREAKSNGFYHYSDTVYDWHYILIDANDSSAQSVTDRQLELAQPVDEIVKELDEEETEIDIWSYILPVIHDGATTLNQYQLEQTERISRQAESQWSVFGAGILEMTESARSTLERLKRNSQISQQPDSDSRLR